MFSFTVTPDDGPAFTATAGMRDVLVWEKTNKRGRVLADFQRSYALQDGYHIAWCASRRQGLIDASLALDQFEKTCEVTFDEEEEERADPTGPEASTAT